MAAASPIYLDYQATTPLAPEAYAAMLPWLGGPESAGGWANPHSAHLLGRKASAAVEVARGQIDALMPKGGRVIFTSGATEALNLAIRGALPALAPRRRIVTIATEHAAVRDTCLWLEAQGHDVVLLPVDCDGLVDMPAARAAITPDTALVAAMLVNNEIGVIQPIEVLSDLAHAAGALFVCDAVQGFGRVALPQAADMIAVTAHKIHGPKGIGALWVREGTALEPLIHGGGQEQGLRSGTLSPALCAGFGAAAKLAAQRAEEDAAHVAWLRDRALELFAGWQVNGSLSQRYPGNLNLRRDGLDVARLMSDVRGVAFSAGSACASGSGRPSHVLTALGLSSAEVRSSIRLGFGRYTGIDEIERAAHLIVDAANRQMG
ncbi:MAG: aminotransferase [Sphingomonadales bacterium RIFCSPHIGHO2_01_FULL_65_20]|uniref:cysteine desulfurase family protein n=1 Tax=unclassified Blastomonas TaxID=2626550 RepID=UPI00082BC9E2|nr:cysteine desulfurase [Blastomonas sp.]MCH2236657.1 cysteine desulfurase [Blastomonas sp.]OHC96310.1 MAG: aminotransferase [Sphingomonadales bacterium RIFCSPHIGHO2_01_FULL_65_20]